MSRSGLVALLFCLSALAGCQNPPAPKPPPVTPPLATTASFPLTIKDDLGLEMTFAQAPQRIITLAPSLTEIAFALGLGDRIVGVTNYCKYPVEAQQKEKVGGYVDSSEEKIGSLAPDVIFATRGTPKAFMDGVRGAGLKVFALDQGSFEQIATSIETMGRVCGVEGAARKISGSLRGTRNAILAKTMVMPDAKRWRAMMIVSLDPLFVAGAGTFQDDMLRACGTENAAGKVAAFGNKSLEAVVQADPQVLNMSNDENGQKMTLEAQLKKLKASPAWRETAAVKQGRVYVVDAAHVSVPGPRLELGLKAMAHAIHPELFPNP